MCKSFQFLVVFLLVFLVYVCFLLYLCGMKRLFLFCFLLLFVPVVSWACTSFIISGKATPSGRPMMFKHRDTGELNNRIAYFDGPKYRFIGLVNSPVLDGEVWSGMNEVGFCIMNTASYNLREDSLDCQMDREGEMMYHALGNCANLVDFESWLETYPKPWGVEANFGVIDAQGGAAYYEMNNHRWIKYDVNTEELGYRVVTNFSNAGRYEEYEGYERYLTATAIMRETFSTTHLMTPVEAINHFSRRYRHELLGIDYTSNNAPKFVVDQDFIPRRITSSVVVFEGVSRQQESRKTLMWTVLGYPACAVAIPLVMNPNCLPAYMQKQNIDAVSGKGMHSEICDLAMTIKDKWIFPLQISNGRRYIALQTILCNNAKQPSLLTCVNNVERRIIANFIPVYNSWLDGRITDEYFFYEYEKMSSFWFEDYKTIFTDYLK